MPDVTDLSDFWQRIEGMIDEELANVQISKVHQQLKEFEAKEDQRRKRLAQLPNKESLIECPNCDWVGTQEELTHPPFEERMLACPFCQYEYYDDKEEWKYQ